MGNKKFAKNLIPVIASNIVTLLGSIITGFIIPKMLGVEEYGFYKVYTLYLGYAMLLHFGFVDGILLKFAGTEYSVLNKKRFRLYSKFYLIFQITISIVIVLLSLAFLSNNYKLLFSLLALDTLALNITAYYQYVSQSTMRFKELSKRNILLALLKICLVLLLLTLKKIGTDIDANLYILGVVVIDGILLFWYMITYQDITFGEADRFKENKKEILDLFKNGIFLTVAFQVSRIVFALDRQFVSVLFDIKTYGIYSFAYSLISMVTTVVGAVAVVLLPMLKRSDASQMMKSFSSVMAVISIVSFGSIIGYHPLSLIICRYLSEYEGAIKYLLVIFPGLALSCCINIVLFTYYKALDKHKVYFGICCGVLFVTIALNGMAYYLFRNPLHISIASIVTLFIWYLCAEYYFIKKYNVKWKKNLFYIVFESISFYSVEVLFKNAWIAFFVYFLVYSITTILFYKPLLLRLFKKEAKQ